MEVETHSNEVIYFVPAILCFLFCFSKPLLERARRCLALFCEEYERQTKEKKTLQGEVKTFPGEYPTAIVDASSFQNEAVHALNARLQKQLIEMQNEQKRSQELIIQQQSTAAQEKVSTAAYLTAIEDQLTESKRELANEQKRRTERDNLISQQMLMSQHKYRSLKKRLASSRPPTSPQKAKAAADDRALLLTELRNTKEKFEAVRKANIHVSAELSELKQQHERMQAQHRPTIDRADQLEKDLANARSAELDAHTQKLQNENQSLLQQLTEAKQQLSNLTEQHNNLIIEGNEELDRLHKVQNNLHTGLQQAQSMIAERDQHIIQLQASISSQANETSHLTKKFQALSFADREEVDALQADNLQLYIQRAQQLEREKAEMKQACDEYVVELKQQADAAVDELRTENQGLRNTIQQHQSSAQDNSTQAEALQKELQKELAKVTSDHAALTTRHGNVQSEMQQRDQRISHLEAQSSRLEQAIEDKDAAIMNLEIEKEELTKAKEEAQLQSGEINALHLQQDLIKAHMQNEIDHLKQGNLIAAKQMKDISDDRDNQMYFLKQEKRKVESLERTVKDLEENKIQSLQRQVQTLNGEVSSLRQQDMMNSTPSHTLQNQIDQLHRELKKEQITRAKVQGQFDTANKKIASLNKELAQRPTGNAASGNSMRDAGIGVQSSTKKPEDQRRQQLDADMANQIAALSKQVESLRCDNDRKTEATDKLEKQVVDLSYQAQQNDTRAQNIQKDFSSSRKAYKDKIESLEAESRRLARLTSANAPPPTFTAQKRSLDNFYADVNGPIPSGRPADQISSKRANNVFQQDDSDDDADADANANDSDDSDVDFTVSDAPPAQRRIAPLPSRVNAVHPNQNAMLQPAPAQTASPFNALADPSQCLLGQSTASDDDAFFAAVSDAIDDHFAAAGGAQSGAEPQPAPSQTPAYDPNDPDAWFQYMEDPNFDDSNFETPGWMNNSTESGAGDGTQGADGQEGL